MLDHDTANLPLIQSLFTFIDKSLNRTSVCKLRRMTGKLSNWKDLTLIESLLLLLFFKYLFMTIWVFNAMCGHYPVLVSRGYSLMWCTGFYCCREQALWTAGFSSCGMWVYLPYRMWDLPRPETKPKSPPLAGRLLTTRPQGKSKSPSFNPKYQWHIWSELGN